MTLPQKNIIIAILGLLLLGMLVVVSYREAVTAREEAAPPAIVSERNKGCVDCHATQTPVIVQQWEDSVHGIKDVGCVDCHGGNPDTGSIDNAHKTNVASGAEIRPFLFSRDAVWDSCANCHKDQAFELRKSVHAHAGEKKADGSGKLLACEHENVRPDGLILGKALGGGIFPVSMFLGRRELMDVFRPGDHGSTFGGNPLGAAIGLEALNILVEERLSERSAELGDYLIAALRGIDSPYIKDIRGLGLFVGVEIEASLASARDVCESLMERGLLSKETHDTVVRLAPPLVIEKSELDWAVTQLREVLEEMDRVRLAS